MPIKEVLEMRLVTIKLPEDMIEKIDKLVKENKQFVSRSEFIRFAILEMLKRYGVEDEK